MTDTVPAAATGLPSAIPPLARSMPRRGFLAGLTRLPLIGGSVALLGQPSAVAEPVTPDLVEAYKTWLHYEQSWLAWEMAADPVHQARYKNFSPAEDRAALSRDIEHCLLFVGQSGSYHAGRRSQPSTRAALVLSAVGCDWRDREDTFNRRRA